jgi:hypothetical protein
VSIRRISYAIRLNLTSLTSEMHVLVCECLRIIDDRFVHLRPTISIAGKCGVASSIEVRMN